MIIFQVNYQEVDIKAERLFKQKYQEDSTCGHVGQGGGVLRTGQHPGQVEEVPGHEPGTGHGQVHGLDQGVAWVRVDALRRGGESGLLLPGPGCTLESV